MTSHDGLLARANELIEARHLDDARRILADVLTSDPDCAFAFNSLAMVQRLGGEYAKAEHNLDAGCKALARSIVKTMPNRRSSRVLKHVDTVGTIWAEHATYAALFLVSLETHLAGIALPTGEQAMAEERTEAHGGLFWEDVRNQDGETVRLLLPNYFNTFRELLKQDATYSTLLRGRAEVLLQLQRKEEAQLHLDEALEFAPTAG